MRKQNKETFSDVMYNIRPLINFKKSLEDNHLQDIKNPSKHTTNF